MAKYTLCVRRATGALRWVVPYAPDFTPTDEQTEDVVHVESEEVVTPATHRYANGRLVRLSADEEAARRAALIDERLDQELLIAAAVISVAVERLALLYPSLEPPTDQQKADFRQAVREGAKALLRASIRGPQHG